MKKQFIVGLALLSLTAPCWAINSNSSVEAKAGEAQVQSSQSRSENQKHQDVRESEDVYFDHIELKVEDVQIELQESDIQIRDDRA